MRITRHVRVLPPLSRAFVFLDCTCLVCAARRDAAPGGLLHHIIIILSITALWRCWRNTALSFSIRVRTAVVHATRRHCLLPPHAAPTATSVTLVMRAVVLFCVVDEYDVRPCNFASSEFRLRVHCVLRDIINEDASLHLPCRCSSVQSLFFTIYSRPLPRHD